MKVENCSSVSRLPACILSNRLVSYFPKKEAQRYCSERKNKVFGQGSLEGLLSVQISFNKVCTSTLRLS
jgi:hypothetical protein